MRLDATQQLRLEQKLKLSPRMIQAMEILQLPMIALQERIDTEMASNPVLELRDGGDEAAASVEAPADRADERALVVRDNNDQAEDFQRLDRFQNEFEPDVWSGDTMRRSRAATGERDAKLDAMANTPAPDQSLYEHLMAQWAFVEADEKTLRAGEILIEQLDDDGYLREELADVAARAGDELTRADFQAALPLVQKLDPIGVAARDLNECLLLQLDIAAAAGHDVALARELVRSFSRDIALNRLPTIARKTGHTVEQVKAAIEQLSRLNPRPGGMIGERATPVIVPDLVVELDDDGKPVVRMIRDGVPSLRISRMYRRMARRRGLDKGAKEFLKNNIRSAQWLMGAIEQRHHTVQRVAEEVFGVQHDFFERGEAGLKPLPMATVADEVGVHVATVSRAVAGKYVQTPRGIFPLRMFFSGGTTTSGGTDLAWDAIKAKLRDLVDAEDKSAPLNDDQLVDQLTGVGIKIARRTVAKYRKLMNIPPARQRRQY